jgi:transposase InsO family protein
MKVAGFIGDGSIAGALRQMGWAISHDTVGRILLACGFPRRARRQRKPVARRSRARSASKRRVSAQATFESRTRARQVARSLAEATELLRLHMGEAVARWRRLLPHTRERQLGQAALHRARHAEHVRILLAHMAGIDPHRRPLYTPEQRLAILAYKHRHRLSNEEVARRFLLHPNTVSEWNVDADQDPPPRRIAPNRSIDSTPAAVERALRTGPRLRDDLRERLFALLLTLCADIPRRRRPPRPATTESPQLAGGLPRPRRSRPIIALRPNHYWMADFTTFWQSDRPDFYLLAILDVFSRRTLAWRLFVGEPTAAQAAALLRQAVARHGKPRHFVSDSGAEFTAEVFQKALAAVKADHRIGAVGEKGSIAIIERFWLSLKTALDTATCPPLIPDVLAERISAFIDWYDHRRPHSALGSATPAELFTSTPSAAATANSPPHGRPGQPCASLGLAIRFALPQERRLPYLERIA